MNLERSIRKLNDLLRSELGEPVYAWKYSEELDHPMSLINDDGSPQMEYVCACGTNVTIHDPACKSLIIARQKWGLRRLRFDLEHQWTLCKAVPNPPAIEFAHIYPGVPYRPVEWAVCDPVYLDKNEVPTEDVTWLVIHKMREHRTMTSADWTNTAQAAMEKQTRKRRDDILDDIKSDAPAFGGIPGKKEHWVSFAGSREPKGL